MMRYLLEWCRWRLQQVFVLLEKRVKLDSVQCPVCSVQWTHFDEVALDLVTDALPKFVAYVRSTKRIFGSERKKIYEFEHHKY